ncbi:MAG: exo-alpha-sialidase [Verrucomicrobia bacterium]|nr:exo-alpha-sialidase [Verrucomicrobiota bacterium]
MYRLIALGLFAGSFSGWCAEAGDTASLKPPQYVGQPQALHAVTNRAFQGIPSMAVSPKGRLWATWYAGVTPGEDHNNYVVLSTSGDDGKTWKEMLVVDPDAGGPLRAYDPELWMAPDGKLWFIFAIADDGKVLCHDGSTIELKGKDNAQTWVMTAKDGNDGNTQWSAPRHIAPGVMMCKPTVLKNRDWLWPISDWVARVNKDPQAKSAGVYASRDGGGSFKLRGAALVPVTDRNFDEHMVVERRDGSLWMLVRTRYGIGESVSTDHGKTWPELTPSSIPHPSARFFITRLKSGDLLLVKHGPMTERTGRSHLMAFISKDDGKTWGGGLLLDERTGVSYPDGQQTPDGLIRIIYDYSRTGDRHILMATFREEDVAAGNDVSGAVRLRQLVSQASGGQEKPKTAPKAVNPNSDGEPLRRKSPGKFSADGFQLESLRIGALLFTDRKYVVAEVPDALRGAQFLRVPLEGTKTLTCDRAGTVWFLTPAPERNRDSQTKTLLNQGFKKVALPEIRLFNPSSTGNFCTLYQKDCVAGDTITIGKWAVPVFVSSSAPPKSPKKVKTK